MKNADSSTANSASTFSLESLVCDVCSGLPDINAIGPSSSSNQSDDDHEYPARTRAQVSAAADAGCLICKLLLQGEAFTVPPRAMSQAETRYYLFLSEDNPSQGSITLGYSYPSARLEGKRETKTGADLRYFVHSEVQLPAGFVKNNMAANSLRLAKQWPHDRQNRCQERRSDGDIQQLLPFR